MVDFSITNTADFDAGTKSQNTNNYEIETTTDNPMGDLIGSDITVYTSGLFNGMSSCAMADDGEIIVGFNEGTSHNSADSKSYFVKSNDGGVGVSFDAKVLMAEHATYCCMCDMSITKLANGDILYFYSYWDGPGDRHRGTYCRKSTDNGANWSSPVYLPQDGDAVDCTSYGNVVELPNGDLLKPGYNSGENVYEGVVPTTWDVILWRSTDGGDSWDFYRIIASELVGNQIHELDVIRLPSGDLLAVICEDNAPHTWFQSVSNDNGDTWSAIVDKGMVIHSNALWLTIDDTLICAYRHQTAPYGTYYRLSYDEGTTWSSQTLVNSSATLDCGHPSMCTLANGQIYMPYYTQGGGSIQANKIAFYANSIFLGNMRGDNFNLADADGITWRWRDSPNYTPRVGTYNIDIDTAVADKLNMDMDRVGGVDAKGGVAITQKVTGDFDVRVNLDLTSWPLVASTLYILRYWVDATHTFYIARVAAAGTDHMQSNHSGGAAYTSAYADTTLSLRIVRSGNNYYTYYDNAGGDSWTQHRFNAGGVAGYGDGYIVLEAIAYNANHHSIGDWSNFKFNSCNFAAGGYRATGNWESAVQTMAFAGKLLNTTITHSGLSATFYIDKIEWLVGGAVQATYDTNITAGTSTTIEEGDLTGGTFDDVDADFTVKVYLAGDGTDTPVVTQIEGYYEMINPVAGGGAEAAAIADASYKGSGIKI